MSDELAQTQLRRYVDRVLNVLAEIDALGDDKKAIYKELADEGFDRSVVSQLVGHLRKKAKKPGKFAEQSALFDIYLAAYEGRVEGGDEDDDETGTRVATHAARESADADGVVEHISPPAPTLPSVAAERQPAPPEPHSMAAAEIQSVSGMLDAAEQTVPIVASGVSSVSTEQASVESSGLIPGGENANSEGNAPASHRPLLQGREEASRLAHNQEIAGSSPAPATTIPLRTAATTGEGSALSPDHYAAAVDLVVEERNPSASMLQRRLGIPFAEANDLIGRMEAEGVVRRSAAGFLEFVGKPVRHVETENHGALH